MTEHELDQSIADLVSLKIEAVKADSDLSRDLGRKLSRAIEFLKEFRKKRAYWRSISVQLGELRNLQNKNIATVDRLRKAIWRRKKKKSSV